jgi:hypothetical protein
VANFELSGQLLTLGGSSVDDTQTLHSEASTGRVESTDGTYQLKGTLNP